MSRSENILSRARRAASQRHDPRDEVPAVFHWPLAAIVATIMVGCTALLGGCGTANGPIDTAQLARPDPKLMQHPRALPDIPSDESTNPAARAAYYAESRNTCGATSARLGGLQSYVRAIHGDPNPAPAAKPKRVEVARVAP